MAEPSTTTGRDAGRSGPGSVDAPGRSTTLVTGSPPRVVDTPWPEPDFEQRRAIDSLRGRLFGRRVEIRIGRYRVERKLGAGGMGEVYLALDEALDRRVAIKRVRGELDRPSEHERLRVEARTLARLSHANVVQIYEVGEHEGQTFLAMEYVEGTTLGAWLDAQPRPWQAVLAVFVAAGRGLAAAHSAGVIHRDFKPDNVLIGKDGRVCVADFGLALAHAAREGGALVQPLEIAGTIRYMPLEQLRGEAVDARSDQFAFCTALCEALWQHAPFDRGQAVRRALELERDQPEAPRRRGVPRGLWPIVRRGLHRNPDLRWPDFDSLLAALEALPRRRRRAAVAALLAPFTLAAAFALTRGAAVPDACAGVSDELAGVWDDAVERELVEVFAASEVEHARASAERLGLGLDAWAAAWIDQRRDQCRAADAPELARARRACLEQQRSQVGVLTTTLRAGDPAAIDHALQALDAVPDPARCDLHELLEGPPLPSPALADEVDALRLRLAEQRSLRSLGRLDLDLATATQLQRDAASVDHRPVQAEALAELGLASLAGGDPRVGREQLEGAARLALAADHPRLLAQTWTELALYELSEGDRVEYAGDRLALAEAAWSRLQPDARTRARLSFARARLARSEGRLDQAIALHREALDLLEGRDDPSLPGLLAGLADALESSEPATALDQREAALAVAERVFGPDHPQTAGFAYGLAAALDRGGDRARALELYARAVAIWTRAHGEPHPDLARAHLLLAAAALDAGELDRATDEVRALTAIHDASLDPDHPDRGDAAMLLGRIAGLRGDRAAALEHAREALRLWSRAAEPNADHLVELRLDIAGNELGRGELAAAQAEYAAILAAQPKPAHAGLARLGLAELALRRGALDQARLELDAVDPAALDGQRVTFIVLDYLSAARAGCRACHEGVAARLAAAMADEGWTPALLAPWVAELNLSTRESQALGLD